MKFLLKIGQHKHIKSLLEIGHLHCETIQYFASLKDEIWRGDQYEKAFNIEFFGNAKMYFQDPKDIHRKCFQINLIKTQFVHSYKNHCGNLFCLYAFDASNYQLNEPFLPLVDDEMIKLGTHVLLIKDSDEFLKRIERELQILNLHSQCDFIKYLDFSTYTGDKTFFQKDLRFKHQNEVRIWIDNPLPKCLDFKIGSIKDIAEVFSVKEFKSLSFYKGLNPPSH